MKKIILMLLAVVAISAYSCTKENQAGQLSVKNPVAGTRVKKDTVPPTNARFFRDTVPPTSLKDTVPPTKF